MQNELLQKSINLFSNENPDKWNAFLDFISLKDEIINHWYDVLDKKIKNYFENEEIKDWSYKYYNKKQHTWFLENFKTCPEPGQSLCLWLEFTNNILQFSLYVNDNFFDSKEIDNFIKLQKYEPLLKAFKIDEKHIDEEPLNGYKLIDYWKIFKFETTYNNNYDIEHLAWFAGNKTEELVNQIAEKVNIFRKDENITKLLYELNNSTKRKNNIH